MRTAARILFGWLTTTAVVACSDLRRADPVDAGTMAVPPSNGAKGAVPPGDDDDASDGGAEPTTDGATSSALCIEGDKKCPVERVVALDEPLFALTAGNGELYFTGKNRGVVSCPAAAGCTPKSLSAKGPRKLAIAGGQLFWQAGIRLVSCPVSGCETPVAVVTEPTVIQEVVSDGTYVVWSRLDDPQDIIRACTASTCNAATAITVALSAGVRPGMAANTGWLAWVNTNNEVKLCRTNGPCAQPVLLGTNGAFDIALNPNDAFWVTTTNEIVRCARTGCNGSPAVIARGTTISAPAVDDTHVYWRDASKRTIERCPLTGCAASEVVARDVTTGVDHNLALDTEYVYWINDQGVFRRRK